MLSIELDKETEAYLVEILGTEKTTNDELIKRLVKERWLSLQPHQTIVERLFYLNYQRVSFQFFHPLSA